MRGVEGILRVGEVQIAALRDCVLSLRLEFQFKETAREALAPFGERYPGMLVGDQLVAPVRAFVIRQGKSTILFDTGLGTLSSVGKVFNVPGMLLRELGLAGVRPDAIDTVILSHLHLDHAGGVTREDGDARVPCFPRARYLLHRADLELAREFAPRTPAYRESVLELEKRGLLRDATDGMRVSDSLTLLHTPGHSPGSMSLLVRSGSEGAVLTADVLPNPILVTEPEWRFGSDRDAALATKTRIAMMERIEREGLVAVPTHMPEPFGGFVRIEGKRYWKGRA